MLFRATRGNCFVRFARIDTPLADAETGEDVYMSAFLLFFRSSLIESKVRRIIDSFEGHVYDVDFTQPGEVSSTYRQVITELEDAERVLNLNIDKCETLLRNVAKYIKTWEWTIKKEKAVYDVFNKFRSVPSGNMYGEGWVLSETVDSIREVIADVHRGKESSGYLDVMSKPWPKPSKKKH